MYRMESVNQPVLLFFSPETKCGV